MRKFTFLFAFLLTLLGGTRVWAGNVFTLTFEGLTGTDAPTGWTGTDIKYENDYLRGTSNWTTYKLTSNSTYTIENGQKIVITAKSLNTSYAKVMIYFSTSSENPTFSSTANKTFDTDIRKDTNNDYELTYENTTDRICYLQFSGYYALIKKIEVKKAASDLTSIDEDVDPGEFISSTPSSLTVKYTANAGWNTICMPIQLRTWSSNHLNSIFGNNWKAYTLSDYTDGILTFSSIASSGYINTNTPLLVYAPNATGTQTELTLSGVAVTYSESPEATSGDATFHGTYAPMSMYGKYGVTSSGKVMQGGENSDIKGYRAYFTGISAPANGARPTIVIEDDGTTTDLGFVKMVDENAKDVYTLSGQRIQKAGKGLYIVNGRKVIVK